MLRIGLLLIGLMRRKGSDSVGWWNFVEWTGMAEFERGKNHRERSQSYGHSRDIMFGNDK